MSHDVEDAARLRACGIWEADHRPEGRARAHWPQAEQEILAGEPPILGATQPIGGGDKLLGAPRAMSRGAQPA